MKKALSLLLAVALLTALLAGCGGNTSGTSSQTTETQASETTTEQTTEIQEQNVTEQVIEEKDEKTEEIHVGISSNIESLSPFTISGMAGGYVVDTIYETLGGYYGFGGEFKGMAMKSWELDPDGYTWHIELYDNIYDTAGNHITTSDILYFYNEAKAQANANMTYIDSIEVFDDYNMDFHMNVSQAGRFERICTGFYVFSQKAYEESPDGMITTPVGTTPYKLTEFVSGSTLTFEATDNYWNNPEDSLFGYSNTKKIVFHIIPEAAQMSIALETGVIDIAQSINGTEAARLADEGFGTVTTDAHLCYMLFFNCDAELGYFADKPELRKAIVYAINRQDIITAVASGSGSELKNIGSSNYGDYSPAECEGDYYSYNPEKAKELIEASGYDGTELRLVVGSSEIHKNAAVVIQAYLQAVGINVSIDAQDNNIYNSTKGDPSAFDLILENKGDQAYMVGLIRNSFDRNNFKSGKPSDTFIIDDELQTLIDAASSEAGHTKENVKAAADYIAEKCYGVGLFVLQNFYAYNTETVESLIFSQWDSAVPGCCSYK